MIDGGDGDPVAEYVEVLRGFGIDDAEVVDLHGDDPGVPDPDAVGHVRVHLDDDLTTLYDRLHAALAGSERGIDAPVDSWNAVPPVRVDEVLSAYGYDVEVEARGTGNGGPFRVVVEDRVTDDRRERDFEFPDGPLGTSNYPALVHAVEGLLGRDPPEFVLLTGREGRWRFVLVDPDDLDTLRSTYGDRVEVFGRPLLCAEQPPAFADGAPPEVTADFAGHAPGTGTTGGPGQDDPAATDADGDPADDPAESDGSGEPIDASADDPDWVRGLANTEGAVDAAVDILSESGPRTYVSDRSADDVLSEVPDRPDPETTTGEGIDDVLAAMDGDDGGPSRVVSDRSVEDVLDSLDEDADEPGAATDADPEKRESSDLADPSPEADEKPEPERTTGTADLPDPEPTAADGEADGPEPFDALAGGGPDETVVEGGVEDVGGGDDRPEAEVEPDTGSVDVESDAQPDTGTGESGSGGETEPAAEATADAETTETADTEPPEPSEPAGSDPEPADVDVPEPADPGTASTPDVEPADVEADVETEPPEDDVEPPETGSTADAGSGAADAGSKDREPDDAEAVGSGTAPDDGRAAESGRGSAEPTEPAEPVEPVGSESADPAGPEPAEPVEPSEPADSKFADSTPAEDGDVTDLIENVDATGASGSGAEADAAADPVFPIRDAEADEPSAAAGEAGGVEEGSDRDTGEADGERSADGESTGALERIRSVIGRFVPGK